MFKRILGIDPGLQITGYAVVESSASGLAVREAGIIRAATEDGDKELTGECL